MIYKLKPLFILMILLFYSVSCSPVPHKLGDSKPVIQTVVTTLIPKKSPPHSVPPTETLTPTKTPSPTPAQSSTPTNIPTLFPISPADYQGWWTYTNADYGFSLLLPSDWAVVETTTGDPLMNGHLLNLRPHNTGENLDIRMSFRRIGENVLLWPTGVGAGEFIFNGILNIGHKPARRMLFICPTGQINSVWYQDENEVNIQLDGLEFGFIFGYSGVYCQDGYSLGGKDLRVGEMIISSLQVH